MVFTRSRMRCENLARKYAKKISYEQKDLSPIFKNEDCWKFKVAYHNGSLTLDQREAVENLIKRREEMHTIFCTSTLAFGINIPARLVIVETHEIPRKGVLLKKSIAKQMVGRAGRFDLDPVGYALYLARNDEEMEYIFTNYIMSKPESISSHFDWDQETHVASLIFNGNSFSFLKDVLGNTFFYSSRKEELESNLRKSLEILKIQGFAVETKPLEFELTKIGKAMIKYFIRYREAQSIIEEFGNLIGKMRTRLVELIGIRGPLSDANVHFFLSILYNDLVEEFCEILAGFTEGISGNRLRSNDLKNLLKMRAYGVKGSYQSFNLGASDFEILFNNLDRYVTFLKESTDKKALIRIFERGLKTSVPMNFSGF